MTACSLGLGVSSCSLVLDWSGYTDGGFAPIEAGDDASVDAHDAHDARDATDPPDATDERDVVSRDAPSVDVEVTETESPPSRCDPTSCGGCCTSDGFCAGGGSAATCGAGGGECQDCTRQGESCDQGVCASIDSGPAPVCNPLTCNQTLCIPVYDSICCRSDGTCGCQVMYPSMGTCL